MADQQAVGYLWGLGRVDGQPDAGQGPPDKDMPAKASAHARGMLRALERLAVPQHGRPPMAERMGGGRLVPSTGRLVLGPKS